jgi:hypothetical protein
MGVNRLAWAIPGHEREYCLNFEVHGHDDYIPAWVERALAEALPGFYVTNRGSRVEVMVPEEAYTDRERSVLDPAVHERVSGVVRELFEPTYGPLAFEVHEVTPVVRVRRTCSHAGCDFTGSLIEVHHHMRADHA